MGRKGGKVKTPKGFSALTPAQRSELGKAAAAKRWADKNNMNKAYTYRTEKDINSSLNALGVATTFTVVVAGYPKASGSKTHTMLSARAELIAYAAAFDAPGMIINSLTGEIVLASA